MNDVSSGAVLGRSGAADLDLPTRPHGRVKTYLYAHAPALVVCGLMIAFTAWFAVYSLRLHDAHLTHKADLGQIDQAIWNTAHGRFVQEMAGDGISTRLTDHVEPIFAPLSLIFWLWNDVRALLVAQALLLALGALPIFLLARRRLQGLGYERPAAWGGVVFAAGYLLAPALQAAAVSEFHALALAPPLVGWAFWAAERKQWLRFALAAGLLMAVQEGMALLGAALGLYVLVREIALFRRRGAGVTAGGDKNGRLGVIVGACVLVAGLAWFYLATFVIVPRYAAQLYGLSQTVYATRYGQLGDSFGDVLKSLLTRPVLVARVLAEPLRLMYLLKMLAPSGFLALFGPEILLLSLPLLLANTLSAFPFQYSGELHYSAPLVPYVMFAGVVGLTRLLRWSQATRAPRDENGRPSTAPTPLLGAGLALVLFGALATQFSAGYTPAGRAFWLRVPGGWPQATAHDRLLARFLAQIPQGAPLSTTADLYPHVSHRQLIYQFPDVGQAQWALLDVAGTTDRHPAAIRDKAQRLLASGWGVVDAADGYLLLSQGQGSADIAHQFYNFARAGLAGSYKPEYPLNIKFGDAVRLLGYDVLDEPKWRRTALRFYWQTLEGAPKDLGIDAQVLAPEGKVVADTAQVPMAASLWYPPGRWQPGEIVATETLPSYLPATWAPVLSLKSGGQALAATGCRGDIEPSRPLDASASSQCLADGRLLLPAMSRTGGRLALGHSADPVAAAGARFQAPDWRVALSGYHLPTGAAPGGSLPILLRWNGWNGTEPGPAPHDYTVFIHLRDEAGKTVANADATPTYFTPAPTNKWQDAQSRHYGLDSHAIAVPASLPAGRYTVITGWYDLATGERLQVLDGQGNVKGDEYVLGEVVIDPGQGLQPDLACLVAPEACASQTKTQEWAQQ